MENQRKINLDLIQIQANVVKGNRIKAIKNKEDFLLEKEARIKSEK